MHRAWWGGLLATALAAGIGGAARWHALAAHAAAGPHRFRPVACPAPAGPAPAPGPGGAGRRRWTTFEGGPAHDLRLGAGAGSRPAAWRFRAGGSVVTAPAVVAGTVYLGAMNGCVSALDARSGRLLWSVPLDNQVMSEPLVVGGRVFVGTGNKGMAVGPGGLVRGTGPSGLYALSARSGRILWLRPTRGAAMPTPAYRQGVLYEATGGQRFYAVSAASGAVLWRLDLPSYVSMSSPTLAGDIAVFGGARPYALYGVDTQTHRLAWTLPLPAASGGVDDGTPAVRSGVAYVQIPEGRLAPRLVELAVRARDGRVLWSRRLGTDWLNLPQRLLGQGALAAHDGEEVGLATVAAGRLYVGASGLPALWALNAADGAVLWRTPLPGAVRSSPLLLQGQLLATGDTRLFRLTAADGALSGTWRLGRFQERSGILIPCTTPAPVAFGQTLLLPAGTDAATLAAIPLGALGAGAG